MAMVHHLSLIGLFSFIAVLAALPAHAQSDDERYTIMRPEPTDLPRKHKARRGSSNPVYPTPLPAPQRPVAVPRLHEAVPRVRQTPPPIYVPQTGQTLPNLPAVSGSGPGGRETFQDRAARCAHQAGVYGQAAGDRNSYVGSCINQ